MGAAAADMARFALIEGLLGPDRQRWTWCEGLKAQFDVSLERALPTLDGLAVPPLVIRGMIGGVAGVARAKPTSSSTGFSRPIGLRGFAQADFQRFPVSSSHCQDALAAFQSGKLKG
ncbi:MAG TPA: hypothetical protein VGN84_02150 [Solirubrobacterales bacterium]|jgi:hypothetical protein|nr:hypothetical protein [Solirubrobacterales bacterium]